MKKVWEIQLFLTTSRKVRLDYEIENHAKCSEMNTFDTPDMKKLCKYDYLRPLAARSDLTTKSKTIRSVRRRTPCYIALQRHHRKKLELLQSEDMEIVACRTVKTTSPGSCSGGRK